MRAQGAKCTFSEEANGTKMGSRHHTINNVTLNCRSDASLHNKLYAEERASSLRTGSEDEEHTGAQPTETRRDSEGAVPVSVYFKTRFQTH